MDRHSPSPVIVWFRQDLRLRDNPALCQAAKEKAPILFLMILDHNDEAWSMGSASRWWLHQSLQRLDEALQKKYQAHLVCRVGDPAAVLSEIIQKTNAKAVYCNRCYEPYALKRDQQIEKSLLQKGIGFHIYNGALLQDPKTFLNQSQQYYRVFTPFWRALKKQPIRDLYPMPTTINPFTTLLGQPVDALGLLSEHDWYQKLSDHWVPGEAAAKDRLQQFLTQRLDHYALTRNRADKEGTSRLSPYLHFGEISPVQIWHATLAMQDRGKHLDSEIEVFLSELAWREFSTHLLTHFPDLPHQAFKPAFAAFPWKKNKAYLKAWQTGLTGYPMVDAGMRELWDTGWMHNRVRMIAASFLIKHLMQPWQEGEAWFWDTLVDADLANNAASWQWVAGSGADAAPYFRIFNPVLQGKKFDPDGEYIKKWIPELEALPVKYIHAPWEAPQDILQAAGIRLGKTYPYPIVEHAQARNEALAAYKAKVVIKNSGEGNQ